MAVTKRIIVLDLAAPTLLRFLMWTDVPAARQTFYAAQQASMVSAWKDASIADNLALQTGAVTEAVDTTDYTLPYASVQANMQAAWNSFDASVRASNPWVRYGTSTNALNTWDDKGVQ